MILIAQTVTISPESLALVAGVVTVLFTGLRALSWWIEKLIKGTNARNPGGHQDDVQGCVLGVEHSDLMRRAAINAEHTAQLVERAAQTTEHTCTNLDRLAEETRVMSTSITALAESVRANNALNKERIERLQKGVDDINKSVSSK